MADSDSLSLGLIRTVATATLIVGVFVAIGMLAWQLSQVLLIIFAAGLLAVPLDALASQLRRRAKLARAPSVLVVVVLLLGLGTVFVWLAGPQVSQQVGALIQRVPQAADSLETTLRGAPWTAELKDAIPSIQQMLPRPAAIMKNIPEVFSTALGALLNVVVIVIIGVYLALDPEVYKRATLALIPPSRRAQGQEVITAVGHALRWFLLGRLAAMALVGLLTGFALWLIGMPLALGLGLLAGLLSFVPFLGPLLSAVPAVLIGFVESPLTALWVVIAFGVVQFVESNFLTPLIQRRVVALPPAGLLISQLIMGVLFGIIGLVLATPVVVALIVVVQILYVRDTLGHEVRVLGDTSHQEAGVEA